ncbi:MAG TPA: cytochrome c biogenesis protein/redoxin [Pyrinomonadaceae bacterium]|jgi:cytochrome c-type biogenesis protein|nr:cytochrome c biogenesis protein/redoxin [Pyrinomonadaceae bacterium]
MEGTNLSFSLIIAFVGGLASFLSPCVLPLVPGYISLISGVSIDHLKAGGDARPTNARRAVMLNSLAFNAGLSLIFIALGAAAGLIGSAITSNPWIRIIGGLIIIGFGLQLMGVLKIGALYRDTRKFSDEKPRGMLGSFTLGLAFAAGWTPCIGPILGGILGLAATSGGWQSGLVLSAFYAAGLAVPFLLTGLGINRFLGFYTRFRRHLHKVEIVSGVLLIAIGLLVATNNVTRLASYASILPNPETWVNRWAKRNQPASQGDATKASNPNASYTPAPDTEMRTLEGQPFRISQLRGRVVLINFWATWCLPCRAEIPDFNAMQKDYEARGFTVVGISSHDTPEMIRDFQTVVRQEYQLLVSGDDAPQQFQTGPGRPATFILDREGRIRERFIGERDRAAFDAVVKPLLDEAQTTASNQ